MRHGGVIPQHAIVAIRHHHRNGDFQVVGGHKQVFTGVVHLTILMLPQSEKAFF